MLQATTVPIRVVAVTRLDLLMVLSSTCLWHPIPSSFLMCAFLCSYQLTCDVALPFTPLALQLACRCTPQTCGTVFGVSRTLPNCGMKWLWKRSAYRYCSTFLSPPPGFPLRLFHGRLYTSTFLSCLSPPLRRPLRFCITKFEKGGSERRFFSHTSSL